MPLTPMSDTPLSPVNEYYKVLNKRIMEEKTAEEIAKTILYFPVTNGQGESSTMKGAKLIKEYADYKNQQLYADMDRVVQYNIILQSTLDLYEKALREIESKYHPLTECAIIASNALNDK